MELGTFGVQPGLSQRMIDNIMTIMTIRRRVVVGAVQAVAFVADGLVCLKRLMLIVIPVGPGGTDRRFSPAGSEMAL